MKRKKEKKSSTCSGELLFIKSKLSRETCEVLLLKLTSFTSSSKHPPPQSIFTRKSLKVGGSLENHLVYSLFQRGSSVPFLKKWNSYKEAKLHSLVQALKKIWCHFGILESCLPTRYKQIAFEASLITEYTLVISCKGLSSAFIASSCPSRLVASLPECSPLPACLNTHYVCWIKSFWLGLDPLSLARNSCLRNIRAILIRHDSALPWPLLSFFLD